MARLGDVPDVGASPPLAGEDAFEDIPFSLAVDFSFDFLADNASAVISPFVTGVEGMSLFCMVGGGGGTAGLPRAPSCICCDGAAGGLTSACALG